MKRFPKLTMATDLSTLIMWMPSTAPAVAGCYRTGASWDPEARAGAGRRSPGSRRRNGSDVHDARGVSAEVYQGFSLFLPVNRPMPSVLPTA